MGDPEFHAQAEGQDVLIRVAATDADSIVWALRMHARHSTNTDYRKMAEKLEVAVEDAFANGAIPRPGLVLTFRREAQP